MKRMVGVRCSWIQCMTRLKQHAHLKPFCTKTKFTSSNNGDGGGGDGKNANGSASSSSYEDAYRQLDKLDFMTAAKILFTSPPKNKKKFGLDFHLVQLFFTCLPSFAVYLVAQYARYEIRRMEAELEVKKAREEEEEAAKAKELESNGEEEKVAEIPSEIMKVNERLDKLEETIKEIVSEPRKQAGLVSKDHQKDNYNNITSEKRPQKTTEPNHSSSNEDSANERMKRSAEPEAVSSPVERDDQKKT